MKNWQPGWLVGVLGACLGVAIAWAGSGLDVEVVRQVRTLVEEYALTDNWTDEQVAALQEKLEAVGLQADRALVHLLWESDAPSYQAAIFKVFLRTGADQGIALGGIREYLGSCRDERYAQAQRVALQYLGERGRFRDFSLCNEYLRSGDADVREQASRSLEMLRSRMAKEVSPTPVPDSWKPLKRTYPQNITYTNYYVWWIFPLAIDFEDEETIAQYQQLEEMGESAFEGLLAIVRECDLPLAAPQALGILRGAKGDKRGIVAELKHLFKDWVRCVEREDEEIIICTADAIADMGEEEDVKVLVPMLFHPLPRVRAIGAMRLGERGGPWAINLLEMAKILTANGSELARIDEAIARIAERFPEAASGMD